MQSYEYELAEKNKTARRLAEIERTSGAERKAAYQDMQQALTDCPSIIQDRLSWLLDGTYGHGEMLRALEVIDLSGRANKPAQLMTLFCAFEFGVKGADVRKFFKSLTPDVQTALTDGINQAIKEWLADQDE